MKPQVLTPSLRHYISIWWLMTWRPCAIAVAVVIPLLVAVAMIAEQTQNSQLFAAFASFIDAMVMLLSPIVYIWMIHFALKKKYRSFQIVLVARDEVVAPTPFVEPPPLAAGERT